MADQKHVKVHAKDSLFLLRRGVLLEHGALEEGLCLQHFGLLHDELEPACGHDAVRVLESVIT